MLLPHFEVLAHFREDLLRLNQGNYQSDLFHSEEQLDVLVNRVLASLTVSVPFCHFVHDLHLLIHYDLILLIFCINRSKHVDLIIVLVDPLLHVSGWRVLRCPDILLDKVLLADGCLVLHVKREKFLLDSLGDLHVDALAGFLELLHQDLVVLHPLRLERELHGDIQVDVSHGPHRYENLIRKSHVALHELLPAGAPRRLFLIILFHIGRKQLLRFSLPFGVYDVEVLLPKYKLIHLIRPKFFIVVEFAFDVEVHHGVHLLFAPEVGSGILGVLANVDVKLLLLFEFFANDEIALFDDEFYWEAVLLDCNFFIIKCVFFFLLLWLDRAGHGLGLVILGGASLVRLRGPLRLRDRMLINWRNVQPGAALRATLHFQSGMLWRRWTLRVVSLAEAVWV